MCKELPEGTVAKNLRLSFSTLRLQLGAFAEDACEFQTRTDSWSDLHSDPPVSHPKTKTLTHCCQTSKLAANSLQSVVRSPWSDSSSVRGLEFLTGRLGCFIFFFSFSLQKAKTLESVFANQTPLENRCLRQIASASPLRMLFTLPNTTYFDSEKRIHPSCHTKISEHCGEEIHPCLPQHSHPFQTRRKILSSVGPSQRRSTFVGLIVSMHQNILSGKTLW